MQDCALLCGNVTPPGTALEKCLSSVNPVKSLIEDEERPYFGGNT